MSETTPRQPSRYFYEPAAGHGLPHSPFKAIIAPRPIGWISTRDAAGVLNLAPYSFFNAVSDSPPIIGFSSSGLKDSVVNAEATGEFCWNLVSADLAAAMNLSAVETTPEIDEFAVAGLTPADSQVVSAPHVAQARTVFECRTTEVLQLKDASGELTDRRVVFGEVVGVHIDQALLKDGIYDTVAAQPMLRGGGPTTYFTIGEAQRSHMRRPLPEDLGVPPRA
ncbi:flavin reductase family protein [Nesterenkonia flava]|uniref:Flavin reductase family protein n=1 Tax=Nesterenkonia flava TaxID=469799 RepID=A0ABU1FUZ2_9MICC|nr:flavin reductase family protein [Nesterenkonia flava]MDR5712471.1 flavin reductase family protein [Nesterenkonia flava]